LDRGVLTSEIVADGRASARAVEAFLAQNAGGLVELAELTARSLAEGGKVLVFGNGGSAADAQHLAGEFIGRFALERAPMAAVALTVDSSVLTCVSNDYGFEHSFTRQVRGLAREGDVVIGISTSGNSPNVLGALAAARERGCRTVGLTGGTGGGMAEVCDALFIAPTGETPRIQECHMAWIHAYCRAAEAIFVHG